MKHFSLILITVLSLYLQINAQTVHTIPVWRQNQIDRIVDLIKNDRVLQLSELVQYPLKRRNPIPDIKDKESFILYYSILFDNNFKLKLINAKYTTDNTIDRYDGFGLLSGDIWLNESGEIITINHISEMEIFLQKMLTSDIKAMIYPSINDWNENILVAESEKFIIRIDLLADNSLRYVSWSKPKSISDKPDLILFNGNQEFQGTAGGILYTFKNSNWTYLINQRDICADDEDCGLFLELFLNDQEKSKIRLNEIK